MVKRTVCRTFAPAAPQCHGDLVHLTGHQADHLELMPGGILPARAVGGDGGEIRDPLILHPDGVLHLGGEIRLKIQIQTIGPGAEGIQHRQRGLCGPVEVLGGLALVQHSPDPLLDGSVIISKAFLVDVGGDQLQHRDAGIRRGGADLDLVFFLHADQISHIHGPAVPYGSLLGGEPLAHGRRRDGNQGRYGQQHRQHYHNGYPNAPFLFWFCIHLHLSFLDRQIFQKPAPRAAAGRPKPS